MALTEKDRAEIRAMLEEQQNSGGGYQRIEGVTWTPLHDAAGVKTEVSLWRTIGYVLAGAVVLVVIVALAQAGELAAATPMGVIAIGGAVVGGLLLLGAGIGMLSGEALRAQETVAPADVSVRGLDAGVPVADLAKGLREGLAGLTAARALVFAGAFLLAVAAIAGALSIGGEAAADDADEPAPAVSPTPAVG
jgi:hypothetical protein